MRYNDLLETYPRVIRRYERYETFEHLLEPTKYNGREVVGVKGSSTMTYPLSRRNKRR